MLTTSDSRDRNSQRPLTTDEEVYRGPQDVENARELDSNVPGTYHRNLFGHLLEIEEAIGCDPNVGARNIRNGRLPANSDEHVFARVGAVAHSDRLWPREPSVALDEGHLAVGEVVLVDAVESGHVRVTLRLDRAHVEGRVAHAETVAGRLVDGLLDERRVEHDLKVEDATLYEVKVGRCAALCGKRRKMRRFMW